MIRPRWLIVSALLLACSLSAASGSVVSSSSSARSSEGLVRHEGPATAPPTFDVEADPLMLDGRPIQISGSMHYYRIHPAYWRDRLLRAAAMGINTVEVYTPWNLHEPYPGLFDWSGMANLERWMDLVQASRGSA